MAVLQYITDFADQAVLLPLAAVVGVAMLATGWIRGALAWACAICGMLAVMLVLKLLVGTCGPVLVGQDLQSPSGHTASAAAIYGGGLALLLRRLPRIPVALLCAGALAILIGITRVLLGAHSVLEVVIGGCVGVTAALVMVRAAGPRPQRIRGLPVAGAILATIVVFHGLHMPAEAAIRKARLTWLPFGICRMPG